MSSTQQRVAEVSVPERVQERAITASTDFAKRLQEVLGPEELQETVNTAHREYVRALKEAWSRVDPDAFDFLTMAAVMQVLMAGAHLRAAATAGVRQRWAAAMNVTSVATAAVSRRAGA